MVPTGVTLDVGDGLECVVTNREEAGGTSGGTFVGSGAPGKAARGGEGRRDAGDRVVDLRVDGEMRWLLGPGVDTRLRPTGRGC